MSDVSFDEIRPILREFPDRDLEREAEALTRFRALSSVDDDDVAADALAWLSAWQQAMPPTLAQPRLCLFAGVHGVAADDGARETLRQRIAAISAGDDPVHDLCADLDADMRLYEMAVDRPSRDFRTGSALDEADCARAIAYGMMAVEHGVDLLAVSTLGIGDDAAAAALVQALPVENDPFDCLTRYGGEDIAGIVGALIAARMAAVPVVLEGAGALAAASVLDRAHPDGAGHARPVSTAGLSGPNAQQFEPLLPDVEGRHGAGAAKTILRLRDALARMTEPVN